jgi:hypothetical protein
MRKKHMAAAKCFFIFLHGKNVWRLPSVFSPFNMVKILGGSQMFLHVARWKK